VPQGVERRATAYLLNRRTHREKEWSVHCSIVRNQFFSSLPFFCMGSKG
jgi:hypothetical protein